jgi:hypothetical protein
MLGGSGSVFGELCYWPPALSVALKNGGAHAAHGRAAGQCIVGDAQQAESRQLSQSPALAPGKIYILISAFAQQTCVASNA